MRIMSTSIHGGGVVKGCQAKRRTAEEEQYLFLVPVVCDDVVGAVGGGYC